ncbi:Thioredoxin-like fold [Macleaya cordata]|uniref:Thioredoxin-like fold n=1 Tax=Macleaya cordata TaxID=56857 RepID=A0A200Q7J8_MACCD|nr:Thioredoxin-like fold [Macleaya cordata]
MAASISSLLFLCISFISSIRFVSADSSSLCPTQSNLFLNKLQFQCPLSIFPSSSIEVDGESLDRALSSTDRNVYTAVLFYASWCPFSRGARSTFDVLSSMFPQIRHLAVEQSSAMPSVFSRYGIHSLPSILLVNRTTKVRYHGPKDIDSLVHFYKRITGLEHIDYITDDQPSSLGSSEKVWLFNGSSPKEILNREPYLVYSIFFLCLRAFLYFFPGILSHLKAFWVSYVPHLNLTIFGETSQLLERVLHVIDVKRVWCKLRLCKARNFRKGAKSAQIINFRGFVSLALYSTLKLNYGQNEVRRELLELDAMEATVVISNGR